MPAYRTMGKYWNVGIDYGRLPATPRQLRRLWHLSGRKVDYRGRALNRYQASEEIERLEHTADHYIERVQQYRSSFVADGSAD